MEKHVKNQRNAYQTGQQNLFLERTAENSSIKVKQAKKLCLHEDKIIQFSKNQKILLNKKGQTDKMVHKCITQEKKKLLQQHQKDQNIKPNQEDINQINFFEQRQYFYQISFEQLLQEPKSAEKKYYYDKQQQQQLLFNQVNNDFQIKQVNNNQHMKKQVQISFPKKEKMEQKLKNLNQKTENIQLHEGQNDYFQDFNHIFKKKSLKNGINNKKNNNMEKAIINLLKTIFDDDNRQILPQFQKLYVNQHHNFTDKLQNLMKHIKKLNNSYNLNTLKQIFGNCDDENDFNEIQFRRTNRRAMIKLIRESGIQIMRKNKMKSQNRQPSKSVQQKNQLQKQQIGKWIQQQRQQEQIQAEKQDNNIQKHINFQMMKIQYKITKKQNNDIHKLSNSKALKVYALRCRSDKLISRLTSK